MERKDLLPRSTLRSKSENQPRALGIDQVFGLGRRLEELDEKAEWCSRIASDLKGSSTSDYIVSALEYYRHERKSLTETPALAYAATNDTLEWCRRTRIRMTMTSRQRRYKLHT
ncbi:hypothetical protein NTE_00484 [Candidatus Nitrososphaera evergladensis SR1]|uniref:Uncharacterized protein n=1 Tax=Candidatus Nitrososphaera evergladensis SR1 TaxID=1459636 RepID=A0A075MN40_9ARCH|nr:hypothetical protein [Candidatus Nitrososphaera evergladensis]AIF82565.1 hypothetical protein NTE_00484 [Candidatus Nitrososphaera evergladensis SR1]